MLPLHLDTDFGGDIDDLCALAFLLCRPAVQLTGLTTTAEVGGRRAGQARYVFDLTGLSGVPVAAGADNAGGHYPYYLGLPDEARYWPEPITPLANPINDALDLLEASIRRGARIVAIGPLTNLALLEQRTPGLLAQADLTIMGGFLNPIPTGYPNWGNNDDFNIQVDAPSAKIVLDACGQATLVPLSVTVQTSLRRSHLPRLRGGGPLGQLIARQAELFAQDEPLIEKLGPSSPALPADFINFQHDPLAAAVATGWAASGAVEEVRLRIDLVDGAVVETPDPHGRLFRVVAAIDGARFDQYWLDVVCG